MPRAVEVLLRVAPGERLFAGASLHSGVAELQRYADGLVAQLALPVETRIEVRETSADGPAFLPGERFMLSIGGAPARVSLEPPAHAGDDLVVLSEALFENRTLLLDEVDLPQLRLRLGEPAARLADADLLGVLRSLVGLCVRTSRLDLGEAGSSLQQRVDRCHDEALAVAIELPPGTDGQASSWGETLRRIWGIPLPPATFDVAPLPSAWHRLRINDVWLPVSPAPAAADIVHQLQRHLPLFVSAAATDFLLSSMAWGQEPLVRAVRARLSSAMLVGVFRGLLAEGVSLAPLRDVLEALLVAHGRSSASDTSLVVLGPHTGGILATGPEASGQPLLADDLVDLVRSRDNRSMRVQLLGAAADPVPVIVGSAAFEADLLEAAQAGAGALRPALGRVAAALGSAWTADGSPRIIVVSSRARRPLRELIALEFASVRVVSWSELPDDAGIRSVAHVK